MIQTLRKSLALALLFVAILACKNDPNTGAAQEAPKTVVPTEVSSSKNGSTAFTLTEGIVNWTSTYTIGKKGHQGTISVKSGELWANEGQLLSGDILLDMNSISVTDLKDPRERLDLESHLKNADFFEVNTFPKAEFIFSQVSPGTMPDHNWVLTGDMTIKGKTAPVNIPVKVSIEGDVLRAESPGFPINRTNWGINFQSGILGTAKDKMIDDIVTISLKVVAKKK